MTPWQLAAATSPVPGGGAVACVSGTLSSLQIVEDVREVQALLARLQLPALEGHAFEVMWLAVRAAHHYNVAAPDAEMLDLRVVVWTSLLHDLGKHSLPQEVLAVPGPLTTEQRQVIELHPLYGHRTLTEQNFVPLDPQILRGVLYHHERFDGSGYPVGLIGAEIPLLARFISIIDVYCALTADRVYRRAWSHEQAMSYLQAKSGSQFDPHLMEILQPYLDSRTP